MRNVVKLPSVLTLAAASILLIGYAPLTEPGPAMASTLARSDEVYVYGDNQDSQRLLFRKGSAPDAPLIVYVHGGAWRSGSHTTLHHKADWAKQHGYAFASIEYRMVPEVDPGGQAQDIGAALRYLQNQSGQLGFDKDRILLMGHSSGAHVSALVGTAPDYSGSAFTAIRAVILLDSAAYDVPEQIANAPPILVNKVYYPAFGRSVARQKALSPITHAGQPDVDRWFILYSDGRKDSRKQAEGFVDALGGAKVAKTFSSPLSHRKINQEFGNSDYPGMQAIDDFVKSSFLN